MLGLNGELETFPRGISFSASQFFFGCGTSCRGAVIGLAPHRDGGGSEGGGGGGEVTEKNFGVLTFCSPIAFVLLKFCCAAACHFDAMRFLPDFGCCGGSVDRVGVGMGSGGGDEVGDATDLNTLDRPLSVGEG